MGGKLDQLTVGDVISFKEKRRPSSKVVTLEHSTTIGQSLRTLAKYRILSAPMVMAVSLEDMEGADEGAGGPTQAPALLGWVDINDILKALLEHIKRQHDGQIPSAMLLLMSALEGSARPFYERAVVTLTGGEDKSLVYETEADALLLQTISHSSYQHPAAPSPGFINGLTFKCALGFVGFTMDRLVAAPGAGGRVVHRLAVFDNVGEVRQVISHLDIIRLLASHSDALLGEYGGQSLQELGLMCSGPSHVVCVDPHLPTLLALDQMVAVGVSGAAVVSQSGQLVANLSTSDLRGIQPEHLGVLALPVAEFLALLHGTTYLGFAQTNSQQAPHPFFASRKSPPSPGVDSAAVPDTDSVRLITCSRDSTLRDVLALMSDNHVHRVYVVDPAANPQVTAVITPTDVLRWLVATMAPPA